MSKFIYFLLIKLLNLLNSYSDVGPEYFLLLLRKSIYDGASSPDKKTEKLKKEISKITEIYKSYDMHLG